MRVISPRPRNAPNELVPVVPRQAACLLVQPSRRGIATHVGAPPGKNKSILSRILWPMFEVPFG